MPILRLSHTNLGKLPEVDNRTLGAGVQGNLQTVEIMRRVARQRMTHPLVRQLALHILNEAGTDSHFYADESKAIGDYVKTHVKYVKDPHGVEQLHDPILMIEKLFQGKARGDCDDMSLLIATLLLSIGHQPYFKMVRYKSSSGPYQHIYVVDYTRNGRTPKKRIVLDAIMKDKPIGFEVPHVSGDEIPV